MNADMFEAALVRQHSTQGEPLGVAGLPDERVGIERAEPKRVLELLVGHLAHVAGAHVYLIHPGRKGCDGSAGLLVFGVELSEDARQGEPGREGRLPDQRLVVDLIGLVGLCECIEAEGRLLSVEDDMKLFFWVHFEPAHGLRSVHRYCHSGKQISEGARTAGREISVTTP
jgi:hypothetical protein